MLRLADIWGSNGTGIEQRIKANGQIVFHSVGDTGNTKGPTAQNEVADKMVTHFNETDPADIPKFFLHLGDVVYSFGETAYYYDQFYDPYRNYPAPIIALAGNHDGLVAPNTNVPTLQAFRKNFCQSEFVVVPQAGGLARTAQIQPGVFFTFEAPFIRIFALYSNTLEDPGVISSENGKYPGVPDVQLDYLRSALVRVKRENYKGALIIAHHHPIYTVTGRTATAQLCNRKLTAFARKLAFGRTWFYRGMRTITSGLHANEGTRRHLISCVAMAVTPYRDSPKRSQLRNARLRRSSCRPAPTQLRQKTVTEKSTAISASSPTTGSCVSNIILPATAPTQRRPMLS